MSKTVLVLLLLVFPMFTYSQDEETFTLEEVKRAYETSAMIPFTGSFEINRKKQQFGLFNKKLRKELMKSNDAWILYKEYRRKSWTGGILMMASLPVGIIAGVVAANPGVGFIGFGVPYTIGIVYLTQGSEYYQRSIWTYNRDMMLNHLKDPLD